MSDPLEHGSETEDVASNPLAAAVGDSQAAAERGDWPAATQAGEQAVELTRQMGDSPEALRTLSVMLYNLATFYAQTERFDDAVGALEEVVALDERTGNEDLDADRQTLEHARMLASMSPEERAEVQRQAEEMAKRLEDMSPEERAAVQEQARQAEIAHIVEAVQQQALAVLRGEREVGQAIEHLRVAAEQASGDEQLGEFREDLAGYFAAAATVLAGETPSSVPAAYTTQIAELCEQSS